MPRPRFEPSRDHRKMVEGMSGLGVSEVEIARLIGDHGIDPKTLRRHFRRELDIGITKANAAVAKSLFGSATSGKYPQAAVAWLDRRGGVAWREIKILEHTGPQGGPLELVRHNRKRITAELARLAAARGVGQIPPQA